MQTLALSNEIVRCVLSNQKRRKRRRTVEIGISKAHEFTPQTCVMTNSRVGHQILYASAQTRVFT